MNSAGRLPGPGGRRAFRAGETGHFLLETLAAVAIAMVLGGTAAPHLIGQRDSIRTAAAARHIAALAFLARAESLKRGSFVGLVFRPASEGFRFAMFVDGNRDGIRSADIGRGVDRQVTAWACLGDHFPRAAFGIVPGVTEPESGSVLSGSPLKLGGSSILSFGPDGTATSGTVYVRGPAGQQYALRILGATGRSRVLQFDFRAKTWTTP